MVTAPKRYILVLPEKYPPKMAGGVWFSGSMLLKNL